MDDEVLSARKDHSVVLGYIIQENRDVLFTPPGVIVTPPVGSERLVIEVHFPDHWLLCLGVNDQPEIHLYARNPATKKETDITTAGVICPDRKWIRARINKPPQNCEICLDWRWECTRKA